MNKEFLINSLFCGTA